jgi:integrase
LCRGEALALHWSDIDLDAKLLRIGGTLARVGGQLIVTETKTPSSSRVIPLSPTAERLLRDLRANQRAERLRAGSMWQPTPYVSTTELGEYCDPRNALRALKAARKRAGLPSSVGLHTLRHSAASVMLSAGVPLKVVSEVFGHASVAITGDIYGHVSPEGFAGGADSAQRRSLLKKVVKRWSGEKMILKHNYFRITNSASD